MPLDVINPALHEASFGFASSATVLSLSVLARVMASLDKWLGIGNILKGLARGCILIIFSDCYETI